MPGTAKGDRSEQRDDHLNGVDQSGPYAYADRDTAAAIGIEVGALSERGEFVQIADGAQKSKETVFGANTHGVRVAEAGNVTDEV